MTAHRGHGLGSLPATVPGQRSGRQGTPNAPRTSFVAGGSAAADWRHAAACLDQDPETWFPIGATGPALLQIEDAKAVCRRCPSVDACLRFAIESNQDHGVWGGMSEDERRSLKRRESRARSRMS